MFEKDAEEYATTGYDKKLLTKEQITVLKCGRYDGFQKGAEFGYNKAKEWHYVKDGDFPKNETEKEYLVALKSEYSGFHYEIDIWCKSLHCFASNNPIKVYAWKEIVLPKESE